MGVWANERGLETVFMVRSSQFYVEFDVYMRRELPSALTTETVLPDQTVDDIRLALTGQSEQSKYGDSLLSEFRQWPSPAQNAQKALKSLSKPFAKIDVSTGNVREFDTIQDYLQDGQA